VSPRKVWVAIGILVLLVMISNLAGNDYRAQQSSAAGYAMGAGAAQ